MQRSDESMHYYKVEPLERERSKPKGKRPWQARDRNNLWGV